MYMAFSTAISGVFLPKVTAMTVRDSDGKSISDLFIKTGRIQYCIMILVLTGFFLFGRQFIRIWAGEGYDDAYIISLIFFVPFTVPLIQNLGLVILQARNQMKFRSLLGVGAAFVSLFIQIPMAKVYGGIGCALGVGFALFVAQGVIMNVYYCTTQKIDIRAFWCEVLKMSVVPVVLAVVTYAILQQFALDSVFKLIIGILAYLVVYLPLFYVFSMNTYERDLITEPIKKILKRG